MRYLITTSDNEPFMTDWFNKENFNPEIGMVVYDVLFEKYTKDGINWIKIDQDVL